MLNRRHILKGLGAAIALPSLTSLANNKSNKVEPKLIFLGFPFGIRDKKFFPKKQDKRGFDLTVPLAELKKHKNDFTIFRHIKNAHNYNPHDGCSTLLTDADIYGTPGKLYQNAVSCDQVAAQHLGKNVRYSSISLSSPESAGTAQGGWGNGLSLSWNTLGATIPAITRPIDLYYKIFGGNETKQERIYKLKQKRSVLDTHLSDFKRLHKVVIKEDREKLEEYTNSLRGIELQLAKEKEWFNIPYPKASMKPPIANFVSGSKEEHRIFYDLMTIALQTGQTNVMTYRLSLDGILRELNYNGEIHGLNHMRGDMNLEIGEAKDKILMNGYSYFLNKLKSVKMADGSTLFDNSAVSIGSNTRSQHTTKDLPLIVSGHLQGKLKQGQQIAFDERNPGRMSDVWLTLLQGAGCPVEKFSTSKDRISEMV